MGIEVKARASGGDGKNLTRLWDIEADIDWAEQSILLVSLACRLLRSTFG